MVWDGLCVIEIKTIAKSDLNHVKEVLLSMKMKHGVPLSNIIADESGVGGGVIDMVGCKGFQANKRPIAVSTKQNFADIKSQLYFLLADYVNAAKIYIEPKEWQQEIVEELEQVKREKEITDDKLRVVKKEHVKEMLGRSPDFSDALMMRMFYEIGEMDYFA
jgi:hypothetical protein